MRLRHGFWMVFALVMGLGMVTLSLGCGDDDDDNGTGPDLITLADFEGSWEATSFTITSKENSNISIEGVALGVSLTFEGDDEGSFTGTLQIPELLGGPMTLPFSGSFTLEDQETITLTFDEEIPPLLTSFTGPFSLDGDTLTATDEDTMFDFMDGNGEVPATATAVLVRN
jgi:hypothetical protein